jgi:hypothetical protein
METVPDVAAAYKRYGENQERYDGTVYGSSRWSIRMKVHADRYIIGKIIRELRTPALDVCKKVAKCRGILDAMPYHAAINYIAIHV